MFTTSFVLAVYIVTAVIASSASAPEMMDDNVDMDQLSCMFGDLDWNEFRNELVVSVFLDDLRRLRPYVDDWTCSAVLRGRSQECVLGAFAMRLVQHLLLGPKNTSSVEQFAIQQFKRLGLPWITILRSGWPIFYVLANLKLLGVATTDLLATALLNVCDGAHILLSKIRADPSKPGFFSSLVAMFQSVEAAVSDAELAAVGSDYRSTVMWSAIACIQRQLYLETVCPEGTYAAEAMAGHHVIGYRAREMGGKSTRHRVCIRLQQQDSSSVDSVLRSFGAWGDCTDFVMSLKLGSFDTKLCTILDVGANLGACSALLAALQMNVVAVEPFPENFRMLRAASLLRDLDNALRESAGQQALGRIIVHKGAAVSLPTSSNISLFYDQRIGNAGTVRLQTGAAKVGELFVSKVPGFTLDEIAAASTARGNFCAIKMDVEGSELGALQGARGILSQANMDLVFLEISSPMIKAYGGTTLQLLTFLRQHGFNLWKLSHRLARGQLVGMEKIMVSEIDVLRDPVTNISRNLMAFRRN